MTEPRGFTIDREFEVECYGVGYTLEACVNAGRDLVYNFIESENLDLEQITFIYGKAEEHEGERMLNGKAPWRILITAQVRAKINLITRPTLKGV